MTFAPFSQDTRSRQQRCPTQQTFYPGRYPAATPCVRVCLKGHSSHSAYLDLSPDACEWPLQGSDVGQIQIEADCLGCGCELDQLVSLGGLVASALRALGMS